jgi:hypothetical protein
MISTQPVLLGALDNDFRAFTTSIRRWLAPQRIVSGALTFRSIDTDVFSDPTGFIPPYPC